MSSIYFQQNFQRAFGTYPLRGEALQQALSCAIEVGYRAIDTAQMYGNEADVGRTLTAIGLPRDAMCITTKVHPDHFSEQQFMPSVEQSLRALQLDYVDVLLLHWPPKNGAIEHSLQLLAEAQHKGYAKHIGVSNYTVAMLHQAKKIIGMPLATNQVEFHPLLDQSTLLAGANETGIPLSSYCSVARGAVLQHALLNDLAAFHSKSAAQIALRWILQKGVSLNTMSTNPDNIRANFELMDFSLSSVEMAQIDALSKANERIVTAQMSPWAPAWDV